MKITCVQCGADITQAPVRYPYGKDGGYYCYDCDRLMRPRKEVEKPKKERYHRPTARELIMRMYDEGITPKTISKVMGCSTAHVYKVLSE